MYKTWTTTRKLVESTVRVQIGLPNWLRSRSTIDFLGIWEKINNPHFKGVEFDSLRIEAGVNSFTLSQISGLI
jgi:hypothetical protein